MDPNESISALKETFTEQGKILKLSSISDVVRRDCALLILQSITDCLQAWPEGRRGVPEGIIREGLALVLSEMGPGDSHLRMVLLETLQNTSNGRQQLLDILPYSMPLVESERENATDMILKVLRDVLLKDSSSLLPILGSLSTLSLSDQGRQEAWKLALVSLPALAVDDFPVVVHSLLRNVSTKDEALQALDCIRTTVDDITLVANLVLTGLQQSDNGSLLSGAYIDILAKIAIDDSTGSSQKTEASSFVLLDLVVMLDLYQRPDFKSKIEALMDGLLQTNAFPFAELMELTSTIRPRQRSMIQERMQPALQELGLFLLLSPVRVPYIYTSLIMTQVHDFLLELNHRLDRTRQEELVRSLLHLGDEVSSVQPGRKRKRGQQVENQRIDVTCQTVHRVVMSLATADPSSIARFKFMLIERLTSEKRSSGYQQVCSILVTLLDGGFGGGMDSTELMILLQKLLFSSSMSKSQGMHQENVYKVSRGLMLANFMVQSSALSANDKECIYQWVLKILLPSNRRTVQPRVGSNGLDFLSTWSTQPQGNQATVFQHVKMIMANTGLVQMKQVYLQRKRTDVDIAYTEIPDCFVSSPLTTNGSKKKRRDLLFCVKTFLQFRGLPSPSDWAAEVSWVFTLVDAYLQQGRKDSSGAKRSKWLPDGWLEASLEIPAFPFSKESTPDESLVSAFKKYTIGETADRTKKLEDRLRTSLHKDDDFLLRKKQTENLARLALALLLSMGLSIAVLRNSHDHFKGLQSSDKPKEETNRRNIDVLDLLKYQLLKVYDLKDRADFLLNIFDSLALAINRCGNKGDATPELDSQQKLLEEAAAQGRSILSSLLKVSPFLDFDLMKTCLIGESDNKLLLQEAPPKNGSKNRIEMVVLLRSQVLEHFVSSYSTHKIASVLDREVVRHCSALVVGLLPVTKANSTKQVSQRMSDSTQLLSSYLEYIICVLDHVLQQQDSPGADNTNMLLNCMLNGEYCTAGDRANVASNLFDQFLRHLQAVKDPTLALQVVEILALIAHLDPSRLLKNALSVCWRMMHTIYSPKPMELKTSVSPSFDRISKSFLGRVNGAQRTSKVLRASIVKCSTSQLKDFTTQPAIRRSLLLLWSLLVQPSASTGGESAMLSSLVDDIETYVQGPAKENAPPTDKPKATKKETSQNEVILPTIPSLNGGTLVVYVEITLHLIISTLAVLEPARCGENKSPFSHLTDFSKLFGRFLTLAENSLPLFPKRFVSLLVTCCHHLLELSVSKTQQCVEWRNSQPLLTSAERQAGKFDYASIRYLEELLQDVSTTSVGTVASFCLRARKGCEESFGGHSRKVTALLLAAKRTAITLKNIALTYNVVPAKDPFDRKEESGSASMEKVDVKGFHHEDDDEPAERLPGKRKKQRVTPTVVVEQSVQKEESQTNDDDPEEEYEWQGDDDKSSDGFGVSGNWGSDDSDQDSDECGSLELESGRINIFPMAR